MTSLSKEDRIIRAIVKEYGPRLDLEANPGLFIELVRKYAFDLIDDGGLPPGGVGPTSRQHGPGIEDVMKEILKLQRQLSALAKKMQN